MERSTIINDPVHGHIELDSLYVKIIDTPQFQRLRFLKQNGTASFVFPGAVHTRFEHSIGVCFLAETMCLTLKDKQPELNITDGDVKCVAIAGLCHDLGHGPFSHLFDGVFLPRHDASWSHEVGSLAMFDYLVKDNGLESLFEPRDLVFIKEQINPPASFYENNVWQCKGRNQEKSFLYEIVANKRNGIDVDKWDYIARDCHYLGIRTAFDHNRLMKFVRVLEVYGEKQICTNAKEVDKLYELFHSRMSLFKQAYLHKTVLMTDYMISNALESANDHIFFKGSDGQKYKMSETIHHMPAFMKMTDVIFQTILNSDDPNLETSQRWLNRILTRKMPKLIGRFTFDIGREWTEQDIKTHLIQSEEACSFLEEKEIIVTKRKFNYGMGTKNPIDHCWFYDKRSPNLPFKIRKEQVSSFLPSKFSETQYLVFLDGLDEEKLACAKMAYQAVCKEFGINISMGVEHSGILFTPPKSRSDDSCRAR